MSSGADSGCFVFSYLNHPSNIGEDDVLHYVLGYQMGNVTVSGTSSEFRVPNCTIQESQNLAEINVSAVNRCGTLGNSSVTNIITLSPDVQPIAPQDEGTMSLLMHNIITN
jgi:hypothetical protein